jgi:selenocysteine-specific translation elongation factor
MAKSVTGLLRADGSQSSEQHQQSAANENLVVSTDGIHREFRNRTLKINAIQLVGVEKDKLEAGVRIGLLLISVRTSESTR